MLREILFAQAISKNAIRHWFNGSRRLRKTSSSISPTSFHLPSLMGVAEFDPIIWHACVIMLHKSTV